MTTQTLPSVSVDRHTVARPGMSGMRCSACDNSLTLEEAETINPDTFVCPVCRNTDYPKVDVLSSSEFLLGNPDNVKEVTWFHATNIRDWVGGLEESELTSGKGAKLVHLGSFEAASERIAHLSKYMSDPEWWIHEVHLREDAEIASSIYDDEDSYAPQWEGDARFTLYSGKGATRYINQFESVGSISLLANPNCFKVVDSWVLEPE